MVEKRNLEAIGLDHPANESDAKSELKQLRLKNINRAIVGYLNINSIRNKFDALKDIVSQNIDILMVAEIKIGDSFPKEQFSWKATLIYCGWTEMLMAVVSWYMSGAIYHSLN